MSTCRGELRQSLLWQHPRYEAFRKSWADALKCHKHWNGTESSNVRSSRILEEVAGSTTVLASGAWGVGCQESAALPKNTAACHCCTEAKACKRPARPRANCDALLKGKLTPEAATTSATHGQPDETSTARSQHNSSYIRPLRCCTRNSGFNLESHTCHFVPSIRGGPQKMATELSTLLCQHIVEQTRAAYGQMWPPARNSDQRGKRCQMRVLSPQKRPCGFAGGNIARMAL